MTSQAAATPNPLQCPPIASPYPAYFDDKQQAWILSRYADVIAALLEPKLWPVSSEIKVPPTVDEQQMQARIRRDTLAALPKTHLAQWINSASSLAQEIVGSLPTSRPIDLVSEFVKPWSLALAIQVTGADPEQAPTWDAAAELVTKSTADPKNSALKEPAAAAEKELAAALANSPQPMAAPAFISLSQTVPALLANCWHILLNHESAFAQLQTNKTLMPKAMEELLRMAGLARIVHRRALEDVALGSMSIKQGQRIDLLIQSANHDPEQFPEPYKFDLSRPMSGHFALGAGGHACAASALIRMAVETATSALVDNFVPVREPYTTEWLGGSGFQWPARVLAQRHI